MNDPAPAPKHWPRGVAAFAAAIAPSLVVVSFDQLEGIADRFGYDGGSAVLFMIVGLFLAAFAVGVIVLTNWAAQPAREGLWSGIMVAAIILVRLLPLVAAHGFVVVLLAALFAALAVAAGAGTGLVAQRVRGAATSQLVAWTAICAASVVLVASVPFLPDGGDGVIAVGLVVALLGGIGVWSLSARKHASD